MIKGLRVSNTNCCITGCSNKYSNTKKDIKFYSFPKRSHEVERKQVWISNINRYLGANWEPKPHSRICSEHFLGNIKSNNPLHPGYNPTLFTQKEIDEQILLNTKQSKSKCERYKRAQKRLLEISINAQKDQKKISKMEGKSKIKTGHDMACQVNFLIDYPELEVTNFKFECHFSKESNDVATIADIPSRKFSNKTFIDKCVDNKEQLPKMEPFNGYHSLKNNLDMMNVCGVKPSVFTLLASLLLNNSGNEKLCCENRLVLFLMKINLGLSYRTLSVLFGIHPTDASRIFISVLERLIRQTTAYIHWPDKETVSNSMPKIFKTNFPNCRVIIDDCDIKVEQPIHSENNENLSVKFIVGITPSGFISFLSDCYGDFATRSFMTNDCGILDLLNNNDLVVVNRELTGVNFKNSPVIVLEQFAKSTEDLQNKEMIRKVQVYIETCIQRIKRYNILKFLTSDLLSNIDDILRICAVLANLHTSATILCPNIEFVEDVS